MTIEGSQRSGADIGFHGSLGLEYMLSPKLGFFIEAVGRYAKLKNFDLVTGTQDSSAAAIRTDRGEALSPHRHRQRHEITAFAGRRDRKYRESRVPRAEDRPRRLQPSGRDQDQVLICAPSRAVDRRPAPDVNCGRPLSRRLIRLSKLETLGLGRGAQAVVRGREAEDLRRRPPGARWPRRGEGHRSRAERVFQPGRRRNGPFPR